MSEKLHSQRRIIRLDSHEFQYPGLNEEKFLDELIRALENSGLDTDSLVFSGFDDTTMRRGRPDPNRKYMYAMNEAGWREEAQRNDANTPLQYTSEEHFGYIGVYDANFLRIVYNFTPTYGENLELTSVEIDKDKLHLLMEIDNSEQIIDDVVMVHKDYPKGSIADALVALVKIEN